MSGAGRLGMEELALQTAARLNFQDPEVSKFAQPIAFNVLPQIDVLLENGYSREEMKMVWETQKIFSDPEIRVNATAVRVPVFFGHSEAVHFETREDISVERCRELLEQAPGIEIIEERRNDSPHRGHPRSGRRPGFRWPFAAGYQPSAWN